MRSRGGLTAGRRDAWRWRWCLDLWLLRLSSRGRSELCGLRATTPFGEPLLALDLSRALGRLLSRLALGFLLLALGEQTLAPLLACALSLLALAQRGRRSLRGRGGCLLRRARRRSGGRWHRLWWLIALAGRVRRRRPGSRLGCRARRRRLGGSGGRLNASGSLALLGTPSLVLRPLLRAAAEQWHRPNRRMSARSEQRGPIAESERSAQRSGRWLDSAPMGA